jgi:hypothetical protein
MQYSCYLNNIGIQPVFNEFLLIRETNYTQKSCINFLPVSPVWGE